jgi:hypothetical protein
VYSVQYSSHECGCAARKEIRRILPIRRKQPARARQELTETKLLVVGSSHWSPRPQLLFPSGAAVAAAAAADGSRNCDPASDGSEQAHTGGLELNRDERQVAESTELIAAAFRSDVELGPGAS